MSQRFFEVAGKLVDPSGEPMKGVLLSVLDSDKYSDDLIGVGTPREDGTFCVSFTREAFNQDWFENEDVPDLYLVVSKREDGEDPKAYFQKSFPGLTFEGGKEDLGTVEVTDDSAPTTVKGSLIYDFSKVRRVDVDEEVIDHVMKAVTERVQTVTGWEDVAAGVPVHQTVQLLKVTMEITRGAIGADHDLPWWAEIQQRIQKSVLGGMTAVYDPFKREIWLDRNMLGQAGLDIMKASIAHELVHAGQFNRYPELIDTYRRSIHAHDLRGRYCLREDPKEVLPAELIKELLPAFAFMCNLEGYARYIEARFFGPAHTCQKYVPQIRLGMVLSSIPVMTIARFSSGAKKMQEPVVSESPSDEEKATAWLTSMDPLAYKAEQYSCNEWYVVRQEGDEPAPYNPALGQELLPELVKIGAAAWDKQQDAG